MPLVKGPIFSHSYFKNSSMYNESGGTLYYYRRFETGNNYYNRSEWLEIQHENTGSPTVVFVIYKHVNVRQGIWFIKNQRFGALVEKRRMASFLIGVHPNVFYDLCHV